MKSLPYSLALQELAKVPTSQWVHFFITECRLQLKGHRLASAYQYDSLKLLSMYSVYAVLKFYKSVQILLSISVVASLPIVCFTLINMVIISTSLFLHITCELDCSKILCTALALLTWLYCRTFSSRSSMVTFTSPTSSTFQHKLVPTRLRISLCPNWTRGGRGYLDHPWERKLWVLRLHFVLDQSWTSYAPVVSNKE